MVLSFYKSFAPIQHSVILGAISEGLCWNLKYQNHLDRLGGEYGKNITTPSGYFRKSMFSTRSRFFTSSKCVLWNGRLAEGKGVNGLRYRSSVGVAPEFLDYSWPSPLLLQRAFPEDALEGSSRSVDSDSPIGTKISGFSARFCTQETDVSALGLALPLADNIARPRGFTLCNIHSTTTGTYTYTYTTVQRTAHAEFNFQSCHWSKFISVCA